jgi:aspartyl protease family protein
LPEQTVAGGETRVPLAPDGHFWIRAKVNGKEASFLVDTGATLTAVSASFARRAGLEPRVGSVPVRIATANGTVAAQLTTIDTLRFGNVKAGGLDAVIAPNIGETNVIGMNLLSRLASWRVEGETMILVPHNPQPAG